MTEQGGNATHECSECGALLASLAKHRDWHEWLNRVIGEAPPPTERSGKVHFFR